MTTILGIDPGLRVCGYAVIQKEDFFPDLLVCGVHKPPAALSIQEKCLDLFSFFKSDIIPTYKPDVVSVENQFVGPNPLTSMKIVMAKTACIMAAASHGLLVEQYSPLVIKGSISTSKTTKEEIKERLERVFARKIDLPLDATDAIAVALTYVRFKYP